MPDQDDPPELAALLALRPAQFKSPNAWAVGTGVNRNVWSDARRRRGLPDLDIIERLLAPTPISAIAFLASLQPAPKVLTEVGGGVAEPKRDWRDKGPPRMPLLGGAVGGEYGDVNEHIELVELDMGEILEWRPRPDNLIGDPDAYYLRIYGNSMSPRFEPHEEVSISPRSPIGPGDDVIVQLRSRDARDDDNSVRMVLIKRLVRRTAGGLELRQFNPDTLFHVPIKQVALDDRGRPRIHRVMGARF